MPAQWITGRDVGGEHGSEVNGGGRLVPSETPTVDTMTGVWSWSHRGVHDGTTPPHARGWPTLDWSWLTVRQIAHQLQVNDLSFPRTPMNDPAPSPYACGTFTRGMACNPTSICRTGRIGSGSCRSNPTPSPDVSNAGAKYQRWVSLTATTHQRNVSRGGKVVSDVRPYNAASRKVRYRSKSTTRPYHH